MQLNDLRALTYLFAQGTICCIGATVRLCMSLPDKKLEVDMTFKVGEPCDNVRCSGAHPLVANAASFPQTDTCFVYRLSALQQSIRERLV